MKKSLAKRAIKSDTAVRIAGPRDNKSFSIAWEDLQLIFCGGEIIRLKGGKREERNARSPAIMKFYVQPNCANNNTRIGYSSILLRSRFPDPPLHP